MTAALTALAACGATDPATKQNPATGEKRQAARSSASPNGSGPRSAQAAELIDKAIDATLGQKYLRSTRRSTSEGTTVMHSAVRGDTAECRTHASKGAATLDWVITGSALYTRGSRKALMLSSQAKTDPESVAVMADRWVKRDGGPYEAMRDMCASKTRRMYLKERLPSPGELAALTATQRPGTLGGRPTTRITYRGQDGSVQFHIAAGDKPLLLRVTNPAKDLDETFTAFGEAFRVAAPAGAVTDYEMAEEVLAAQSQ
ncbi:hypothetical protein [Streptomyces flavofungini]|uniref:hypothetical protein n=1 Tax=Streptomyces flavofungini TaxID=68200 RepID=UPI0034DDFB33